MEEKSQEFTFAAGIDEADDPQGAPKGFAILENVVRAKDANVAKRGGFTEYTTTAAPSGASPLALVNSGNGVGVVTTAGTFNLARPFPSGAALTAQAAVRLTSELVGSYFVADSDASRQSQNGKAVDVATLTTPGGQRVAAILSCAGKDDSAGTLNRQVSASVSLVDIDTGVRLATYTRYGHCARIISIYDPVQLKHVFLLGLVTVSGELDFTKLTYDETAVTLTAATVYTTTTNEVYHPDTFGTCIDMIPDELTTGGFWYVYAEVDSPCNVSVVHLNLAGTVLSSADYPVTVKPTALALTLDNSATLYVSYGLVTDDGGYLIKLVAGVLTAVMDVLTPSNSIIVSSSLWPYTNGVVWSYSHFDPTTHSGGTNVLFKDFVTPSTVGVVLPYRVAQTKVFASSGRYFIGCVPFPSSDADQRLLQIYDVSPGIAAPDNAVAVLAFDLVQQPYDGNYVYAPHDPRNVSPSSVSSVDAGRIIAGVNAMVELSSTSSLNDDVCEAQLWELGFAESGTDGAHSAVIGTVALVSGTAPRVWDGTDTAPAAFPTAPVVNLITKAAGAGTGTYNVIAVAEYVDANGNLMVSAPSEVAACNLASQKATIHVSLGASTPATSVSHLTRIKLYATGDAGTTYHFYGIVPVSSGNGWEISNVTFVSTTYLSNESLYSDGVSASAPLVYEACPSLSHVWTYRNRMFGVRADDPRTVVFSQEITDPFYPQFNAVTTLKVDNSGGPVYGGAPISDKCLLFQADQVMLVSGPGPDATGAGTFSQPEVAALGVGTTEPGSIVVTPQGVMFRHSTGYKLLGPDMQVSDIGRQVEDTLGSTPVVHARYLPSLHQVWVFPIDSNRLRPFEFLVWDTRYGQWMVFASEGLTDFPLDATERDGVVYLLTTARVYTYSLSTSVDSYTGDGTVEEDYNMYALTPWIRVDRAQEIRCRRVHLTGTAAGNFDDITLTLDVYSQRPKVADHDGGDVDASYAFTMSTAAEGKPFSRTARLVTQRCTALRVAVTVESSERALSLTTLTVDYGVSQSRGKTPVATKPSVS